VLVQDHFGAHYERVNAYERNWYSIVGRLQKRAGIMHLELGAASWAALVEARQQISKSAVRLIASRPAWPKQVEWQANWVAELMREVTTSPNDALCLDPKSSTSVLLTRNIKYKEASKKALERGLSLSTEVVAEIIRFGDGPDDPEVDFVSGSGFAFAVGSRYSDPRMNPLYDGPMHPPYIMPDQHPRQPCPIVWLSPDMVPEQKATYVVDAFRRAVKKVYGIDWFHYFKGDIKKAKHFDKLLAAGVAFADHSVAPEHWAIWRLKWFAKTVKSFSTKPPPVWMVMNAKTVSERAGWFRKDYDLPLPTFQLDPMISEQHLRNQEANHIWRKVANPLMFMSRSYVEKREREIKSGMLDPHDNWPKRRFWRDDT
jgi:hypothetical protein